MLFWWRNVLKQPHIAEMIQYLSPWSLNYLQLDGRKNVWTGREQGGRAGLWRESVCQTSSAVCPVALPQCEAVMGERALPSFLPSFILPSFLPSFCMASSLHSSLLISLDRSLCFPSWLCCGCRQCACLLVHLYAFMAV